MIVNEALRRVQNFVPVDPEVCLEMLQEIGEIARIRLVGPDVFRRVNRVEGYAELLVAGGETLAIDVREDDQLVVPLEIGQGLGGVGEGRPIRNGSTETVVQLRMDAAPQTLASRA
jgi:hypothetical protein